MARRHDRAVKAPLMSEAARPMAPVVEEHAVVTIHISHHAQGPESALPMP